MAAPYKQSAQVPPNQPAHLMAPGMPSSMASNENYRRDPPGPGPPYNAPQVPQHQQNGQQYPYHPAILPNLASRTPLPDQIHSAENGGGSGGGGGGGGGGGVPQGLPAPMGQVKTEETPEPPSHSMIELGRRYTLDVVQQPKRARMCGFGDKDRRPITPPPCIRLIITDASSGMDLDTNKIDFSMYVINVDLWSSDGRREVNLVRHATTSPTISSTLPTSYGQSQALNAPVYNNPLPVPAGHSRDPQYQYHPGQPPPNPATGNASQPPYQPYPQPPQQVGPYGQPNQQQPQLSGHPHGHYNQPQYQQHGAGYPGRPPSPAYNPPPRYQDYYQGIAPSGPRPGEPQPYSPNDPEMNRILSVPATSATGMYTRNLIGSLSASAFRLTDPNDKSGIWFVLQDLSVRTEGQFRLRFSFVNVGTTGGAKAVNGVTVNNQVNTGKAPILASCYSDVFTVYSAKKFPGVVESTPLSKCFATQGIKIPIRKDGPRIPNREEYDDDD